jgi:hypothetical protein
MREEMERQKAAGRASHHHGKERLVRRAAEAHDDHNSTTTTIGDDDLDIVARMDDVLKTYENTRRQYFWHDSSESTKNLVNFNMKGTSATITSS